MMRGFFLSISFLFTALLTLIFSLFFLQYTFDRKNNFLHSRQRYELYSALPQEARITKNNIFALNVRKEALEKFLQTYQSPLTPYAQQIVNTSDKYGLDYRLLPAIAMQESNLCKKAPTGSYNCWGYGIYGKKTLTFENFEKAIETVASGLAQNYKAQGLSTPREIMTKYTPSNTGDWAFAVEYFMQQLSLF